MLNKRKRQPKGQSRMDNQEALVTSEPVDRQSNNRKQANKTKHNTET